MPIIENRNNGEQFPREGDDTDLFNRLSEYINTFDKTWIENIKPASQEQIEELRNVSQLKKYATDFPKPYLIFLETMGVDDGGLLSRYLIGTANIEEIIDLYHEFQIYEPQVFETPYLAVFENDMAVEYSMDLSGKHLESILNTAGGEVFGKRAESFEKLLFQAAFQQFERFKYRVGFSVSKYDLESAMEKHKIKDREEILAEIEKIAEKNQLRKAWFSDTGYDIMLGLSLSFGVRLSPTGGAGGFVTGDAPEIVEQVANEITNMIGAKIYESNLS